jgi:hypothetical protein
MGIIVKLLDFLVLIYYCLGLCLISAILFNWDNLGFKWSNVGCFCTIDIICVFNYIRTIKVYKLERFLESIDVICDDNMIWCTSMIEHIYSICLAAYYSWISVGYMCHCSIFLY